MNNRFDKDASSWDSKDYRTRMAENVSFAITNEVELHPQMSVLDFGCGTGLVSLPFAPKVAKLTGVDTSAGMLDVFLEKAKSAGLTNVESLNLDLGAGAALSDTYDLVLSSMTFHHVKDISAVINTLVQALNPGGMLCIADLDSEFGLFHADNTGVHHYGFDRDRMMERFRTAGLTNVRAVTAANMLRVGADNVERDFSIFLITGEKHR
jgi:2-polyprenyl-3-methyl-5-hydroxy-6-metoxy-1,4-benzoquinol methylase